MLARRGCGQAYVMIVDASGASSQEEGEEKEEEEFEEEDEEEEEEEEEERIEYYAELFGARVTSAEAQWLL